MLMFTLVAVNDVTAMAATSKVTKVTVKGLPSSTLTLAKGKTKKLSVTVTAGKGTSKAFNVKSSNTKVATVKKSGSKIIITAKKNGKAKITVSSVADSKKKSVISLTVGTPVTKLTMSSAVTVVKGKSQKLKVTVTPKKASNKKVLWKSSNTGVATVNANGVVAAKKAGTAVITATAADGSGKTARCKVTVINPNSIASVEVIDSNIVKVTLGYAQKLGAANFTVNNKYTDRGTYRSTKKVEYVTTSDNKTYIVYLNNMLMMESYVKVNVTGLTGVSGAAGKEIIWSYGKNTYTYEETYSMNYNQYGSFTVSSDYSYGDISCTVTGLPAGLKMTQESYGYVYVSGIPTVKGLFTSVFTFTDELGNVEKVTRYIAVGDSNKVVAYCKPAYNVADAEGKCYVSERISAVGGSGSYTYQIIGNSYGLVMDGRYVEGTLKTPGNYKITVKVTDANNTNLYATTDLMLYVKPSVVISGIAKDASGQVLEDVSVYFTNKNRSDRYFRSNNTSTDSTGKYSIVLPAGTYDVKAVYNNTTVYVGTKNVTTSQSGMDITMPLYKIILMSNDSRVTEFGSWYDAEGKYYGRGDTLYLRAGTYKLEASGNAFLGTYTAKLNITVTKSATVYVTVGVKQESVGTISENTAISVALNNDYKYYKFVPATSDDYVFYSVGSHDTYGAIYDGNGTMLSSNDDNAVDSNFSVSCYLEAGKIYYMAARMYDSNSTENITIKVCKLDDTIK